MKVLIVLVFILGSATAAGSGPYLPSGWKPDGPAFYLPSEVQKETEEPIKETVFQEYEASGSEKLREYGPQALDESPLQITKQGLPDTITEQAFLVVETETNRVEPTVEQLGDVKVSGYREQTAAVAEAVTTITESQESLVEARVNKLSETQPTSDITVLEVRSDSENNVLEITPTLEAGTLELNPSFEEIFEVKPTSESSLEVQPTAEEESLNFKQISAEVEHSTETIPETTENVEIQEIVSTVQLVGAGDVAVGVKNIEDTLVNLEKEAEVQKLEGVEIKVTQETSGSLKQDPKSFLEYGPPGFKEYGPPKDDLLRPVLVQDDSQSNEVRRRRFSPKFRSTKGRH